VEFAAIQRTVKILVVRTFTLAGDISPQIRDEVWSEIQSKLRVNLRLNVRSLNRNVTGVPTIILEHEIRFAHSGEV
jgi:hypothetical protein